MATDMRDVVSRINKAYLVNQRQFQGDYFTDWKNRITLADETIRGDFLITKAGEQQETEYPTVMNLAEAMSRDAARLVAEVEPIPRSAPKDDNNEQLELAHLREAAADTYWEENEGSLWVPFWAMDLTVAGAIFAVAWYDQDDEYSEYPRFMRVDPRFCYPTIWNGVLKDLLVVQRMKVQVAEMTYGGNGILDAYEGAKKTKAKFDDEVEVWDYYAADECVTAVSMQRGKKAVGEDGVFIVRRMNPGIGCPPAVMKQLPSHDGAFRGIFDQVRGSLTAKNKAAKLMIDYTEEQVYAPFEAKNIINATDPPGPRTIYQHDPTAPDSKIGRVAPAGSSPQLFALLNYLDSEQRGQIAYPNSRQGDVSQSIASAAFVESTQGQLSSLVKESQRLIGFMRSELTDRMARLDVKYGDSKKSLVRSVNGKNTFVPSKTWDGRYRMKFTYGPAAGIGVLNGDVRLLQFKGAGIISDDTMRAHIPDIVNDPVGESDKIERETTAKAIQQRWLTDPSVTLDEIIDTLLIQEEQGVSLSKAAMLARKRAMEAQQAAPAQPGQLPTGPEPTRSAPEEALALEKGEVPSAEQLEVDKAFAPVPLEQVFVGG